MLEIPLQSSPRMYCKVLYIHVLYVHAVFMVFESDSSEKDWRSSIE